MSLEKRDIEFAIWSAKRCLHLWNAPDVVKEWLEDPQPETAGAAARAACAAARAAYVAEYAARAAEEAAEEAVADAAEEAAEHAGNALNTTVTDLKFEYVKTWTDDQLGKADDPWIEVATVEILNRM